MNNLSNSLCLSMMLAVAIMTSCVQKSLSEMWSFEETQEIKIATEPLRKSTSEIADYDTLPNPYALSVMQRVYNDFSEIPVVLSATDLYVKFMPQDSAQLRDLIYNYELELFDYPLDLQLDGGEEYVNPNLPETDLVWLYTTVKPDFTFPNNIPYEILEECYIPADDETIGSPTKAGIVNVEDMAFAYVGYEQVTVPQTRTLVTPQGDIEVYDNTGNINVPVKGVKVRCHTIVKWATAYTDANGHYVMNKPFRFKPHYSIVFDNIKDFDIWGNYGPLACANFNMGWHSNAGHSESISTDSKAWAWAVVNNAAYEYYEMCNTNGILTPPSDLKIWVWKFLDVSSTPMLRCISRPNAGLEFFENTIGDQISMEVSWVWKRLLSVCPDITIGAKEDSGSNLKDYSSIYNVVNHELAHASHYSQVGSDFWGRYIDYIINNLGYGNGSGEDAQLCAIGEMWGYFIGYLQQDVRYMTSTPPPAVCGTASKGIPDWVYPRIFWDLYKTAGISLKDIYDCLLFNVDTIDKLVSRMYAVYYLKKERIASVFSTYMDISHIEPVSYGFSFDSACINQDIRQSTLYAGEYVYVNNTTVYDNAIFRLNAGEVVVIDEPFIVHENAEMIINKAP